MPHPHPHPHTHTHTHTHALTHSHTNTLIHLPVMHAEGSRLDERGGKFGRNSGGHRKYLHDNDNVLIAFSCLIVESFKIITMPLALLVVYFKHLQSKYLDRHLN